MAGGGNVLGSSLSLRAITEDQDEEESADYQLMFKNFKENKVEIASAITKPFPFLMSLRDHSFISEEKFRGFQESCEHLVPVERVVYDILCDLQKKFSRKLLRVIFSKTHLKAYPDLDETLRNFFLNVSDNHKTLERINGREPEERSTQPGVVREASCSHGNPEMNDEQAEKLSTLPQYNGGASCSHGNPKMNDEQAEELSSLPQYNGGEGSSSCEQMLAGQEPQDDLSSSPRRDAGAEQSMSEMTCSCVMCSPTCVTEDLEARMGSSKGEAMDTGNITVVRSKKRGKKKGYNWSKPKQRLPLIARSKNGSRVGGQAAFRRKRIIKNPGCSTKSRVPKRCKGDADFSAEVLPVTCGVLKGELHKDKFKQGISVMSIQYEGNWFTPSEFEFMGGHGRSKNWKLSLRCYNCPLKFLIKRNYLPNPPRIYRKKKKQRTQSVYPSPADSCMQNSDECEVCRDGGMLFCCDTCSRAFHEECHIPMVEAEITPWSCIFCRMQSLGSQESLPESEILQRQMVPQEQLKCEFVLLKVYCCSDSSFFSKMPYYYYFKEMTVGVQEPMWLDMIKKKLSEQAYTKVKEFVHDMRIIFQNHRVTFKEPMFGQMGFRLEAKFEENFKEVFAIQETNGNS